MVGVPRPHPTPSRPAYSGDFPDPFVLPIAGAYYAYATQTGATNVQVMISDDLREWRHLGEALPQLPVWARMGRTWSPSVLERPPGYVLYYTARHGPSGRQCISVARASEPHGPFVDTSARPLVCQLDRGGSIDPSPFVDADGSAYLVWKSDDNAMGRPSSLWGCSLAADGLSLAGNPVRLLGHDRGWEVPLVEAPSMMRVDDTYFLFYSANWWESSSYAIGYATSHAPLGRCYKVTKWRAWLASTGEVVGPGGQELFVDHEGATWMAYHAWLAGRVGYAAGGARGLWLSRVDFVDGRPVLLA